MDKTARAAQNLAIRNAVPCRKCKAAKGEHCTTKTGGKVESHISRITDYNALMVEQAATQLKAKAEQTKAERAKAYKADLLIGDCTDCGAKPGEPCQEGRSAKVTSAGIHAARWTADAAWAKAKAEANQAKAFEQATAKLTQDEQYALEHVNCKNCGAIPGERCLNAMLPPGSDPVRVNWQHNERVQVAVEDREVVRTTRCDTCDVDPGIPCFMWDGAENPTKLIRPHIRRSVEWGRRQTGPALGAQNIDNELTRREESHSSAARHVRDKLARQQPDSELLQRQPGKRPPGFIEAELKIRRRRVRDGLLLAYYVMDRDIDRFVDGIARVLVETGSDELIFDLKSDNKSDRD